MIWRSLREAFFELAEILRRDLAALDPKLFFFTRIFPSLTRILGSLRTKDQNFALVGDP